MFCFHQLVPHWSPISFSLPSPGRLAPSRAEVFVGSRCVRLVQALPSFPPLRWSWPVSVDPPLFFFSLAFQGLPAPGQVCWCVFALSFFFCVPLFASWLSNFHLIFILISLFIPRSSSFSSHFLRAPPCRRQGVCVCVYRLNRRKTSSYYIILYIQLGITGVPGGSVINEDTPRDL